MRPPPCRNRFHNPNDFRPTVELKCVFHFPPQKIRRIIHLLAAEHPSSFDGMVSTSNHLLPEEKEVKVTTSKPIWWTAELKQLTWD